MKYKEKYVFLGDCNSINIEVICKAFPKINNNIRYIIIGNKLELQKYLIRIKSKLSINDINDPFNFYEYKQKSLNIFNVNNKSNKKYLNLINQIKLVNFLCNQTKRDLITMPINKSIFKKKIKFIGMTEYLGEINNTKTIMLMYGDKFSVVPFTTHISPKDIHLHINNLKLESFLKLLTKLINNKNYGLNFKDINFLCYNPHCGESQTMGDEDKTISNVIKKFRRIKGPYSADSAFLKIKGRDLFISSYHDQGLIPFKTLNKKGINFTLGLQYKRLSPSHGTATDIIYKNLANDTSYLTCMRI